MPKISVIVPVYNVEKYISTCLESLLKQTLSDIEIICIDDCGTDESMRIVKKIAKTDKRIKIIHNEQNSGLSESRNNGMKCATAPYIMFCDSDDWFAEDMCEKMYNAITCDNADLAICGTEVIYEADHDRKSSDDRYFAIQHGGTIDLTQDIQDKYSVCAWNKIYKREIINKYNVLFPRGLKYEDNYFYSAYCLWVEKVAFVSDKLYKYRRRAGSIMNNTYGNKVLNLDTIKIAIAWFKYATEHNKLNAKKNWFWGKFFYELVCNSLDYSSKDNHKKCYEMAQKFIQENLDITILDNRARRNIAQIMHRTIKPRRMLGGLIKIQTTPDETFLRVCGVKVLRAKYDTYKTKYYLMGMRMYHKTILDTLRIKHSPSNVATRPKTKKNRFIKKKMFSLIAKFPINNRKVVFISFDGGGYGCNPKYIAREMLKRNNLKLYWLYSPKKVHSFRDFPRRIKKIPMKTIYEYYHLCTAGCIIANNRTEIWNRFTKRPGQLYIQTWHGNMCFKKIEADVPNLSEHYVALAKQDAKNTDILLCGSRLRQKTCFEKSFFYDGSIAKFGLPRNDILLQTEDAVQKATVCEKLSIPTDVKILIYAPTFRDSGGLETYSIDYTALKYVLEQKFGGKWIILSRLHPNLCAVDNVLPNLDYVVDASKYPDMQELLMISDMMITDYSGCAFDFLLTKRPIFIFATDIQEYAKERDFYFPLQSTPFAIAETNQQLQQNIMNFNPVKYRKSADKFLKQCGMYETGKASEICVNMVEQFLKKGCLDENI